MYSNTGLALHSNYNHSIILFIYGNFRSDIEDHIYEQELDKAVIEAKEVKVDSTVQKTNKSQVKVNDSIIGFTSLGKISNNS